jgi:hypothetical protein
MKRPQSLQTDTRVVSSLEVAIDCWLAARKEAKIVPSNHNEHAYNATLFALGEAWAERYPEGANTPEAFWWYLRGLCAPDRDE